MPKKGKKKKGKAAKAGVTPAKLDEAKAMKLAKEKLEMQLDVKSTQLMNLQEEYQRSQDLIHTLERRLRKDTGSLKEELQLVGTEHLSRIDELEFLTKTQKETIKLYESQLHAAEVVVNENEVLRKRVSTLNQILQNQSTEHAAMMHNMNSDRFNIRLQLEQAFRKALVEAKEKSQEDALEAMSEESKKAIQLNRELTLELESQSRGIRKMCEHFDMRDSELKAVKLESRLNQSQIDAMTSELTRLAKTIQKQKMQMKIKDDEVAAKEVARLAVERQAEKLRAEVAAHKATIGEKDQYIKTMQARIYFLSEKLSKALTRKGRGLKLGGRSRSSRQKELISRDSPTASNQTPAGSKLLSSSFRDSTQESPDSSFEDNDDGGASDPDLIWNAELRNLRSPRERAPKLRTVSLPNRDPLNLDGTRSNRTSNTSTQFVP